MSEVERRLLNATKKGARYFKARKNVWPCEHSTECCSKRLLEDEYGIVIPIWRDGRPTDQEAVLHARCMRKLLKEIPLDPHEIEAKSHKIRAAFRLRKE